MLKPKRPQSYNTLLLVNEWLENETRHGNNVIQYYVQVKPQRPQTYNVILLRWSQTETDPNI